MDRHTLMHLSAIYASTKGTRRSEWTTQSFGAPDGGGGGGGESMLRT